MKKTRVKAELLRAIVMEHKALEYWALSPSLLPANIQDRTIAQLKTYHFDFKAKLLRLKEERNAVPEPVRPVAIVFDRERMPEAFEALDQIGRFSYTLPPQDRSYLFYARTLVNQARILGKPRHSRLSRRF